MCFFLSNSVLHSASCKFRISGQPIVLPNSLGIVASDAQFPDARFHLSTRLLVALDPKCIHDQVTVGLLRFHGRRSIGSEPPHSSRPLDTSCGPHPDVIRLIYRSQSACSHRCGPRITTHARVKSNLAESCSSLTRNTEHAIVPHRFGWDARVHFCVSTFPRAPNLMEPNIDAGLCSTWNQSFLIWLSTLRYTTLLTANTVVSVLWTIQKRWDSHV